MCFIFFYYYTTIYATADQDCPGYFLVSLGSRLYFWDHQPKLGERMFSWEKIAAAIARVQKNDFYFLVYTLMANESNLKMHYIYIINININYPLSITYIYIISRFTNHFFFFYFMEKIKKMLSELFGLCLLIVLWNHFRCTRGGGGLGGAVGLKIVSYRFKKRCHGMQKYLLAPNTKFIMENHKFC